MTCIFDWKLQFLASLILIQCLCFQNLIVVEATIADGKSIVYSLPRPGIHLRDDPYTNLYYSDFERDLGIMHNLGATTVVTFNAWKFGRSHSRFLDTLKKYNMTLGMRFSADFTGSMRRDLETLSKWSVKYKVPIEFIFVDYPLNYDNSQRFFLWLRQVKNWMTSNNIICPLFVRWFPDATDAASFSGIVKQWEEEPSFDAWIIEAYSPQTMENWKTQYLSTKKGAYFLYGADSLDIDDITQAKQLQAAQLEELISWIENDISSRSQTDYSGTIGGALFTYSDIWYLGSLQTAFQGYKDDLCPDKNPYIQTSCGVIDNNIEFGDSLASAEHLGIMKFYETVTYRRCVEKTDASDMVQSRWNPQGKTIPETTCVMSLTIPGPYIIYLWSFGGLLVISGIITGWIKSCIRERQRKRKLAGEAKPKVEVSKTSFLDPSMGEYESKDMIEIPVVS